MANFIGLILVCYGSWLLYDAFAYRRRQLASPPSADAPEPTLAVMADVMPPLIFLGLGIAALEMILAYVMIAPNKHFALFDLIGILYAMFGYGTWIALKTKSYRVPSEAADG